MITVYEAVVDLEGDWDDKDTVLVGVFSTEPLAQAAVDAYAEPFIKSGINVEKYVFPHEVDKTDQSPFDHWMLEGNLDYADMDEDELAKVAGKFIVRRWGRDDSDNEYDNLLHAINEAERLAEIDGTVFHVFEVFEAGEQQVWEVDARPISGE